MNLRELLTQMAVVDPSMDHEIEIDMHDPKTGGGFDATITGVRHLDSGVIVIECEMTA